MCHSPYDWLSDTLSLYMSISRRLRKNLLFLSLARCRTLAYWALTSWLLTNIAVASRLAS